MILDSLTKLEVILAGAVTTNQLDVHVDYRDWVQNEPSRPAQFRVATNSANDVTILAAPTGNTIREVLRVTVYNKDTVAATATIKTDDGTTERIVVKQALNAAQSLLYEQTTSWKVL